MFASGGATKLRPHKAERRDPYITIMNRDLCISVATIDHDTDPHGRPTHLLRLFAALLTAFLFGIAFVRAQDTLQVVRSYQVLGPENLSALSSLGDSTRYGSDVCPIGDLNNDGIVDLMVGHSGHPNGTGAVWVHFMAANGTVSSTVLLSSSSNGIPTLATGDAFGSRLTGLGDLDLDGVEDIAVLASGDDAAGANTGAVYICLLNTNGTAKSTVKITAGLNGFAGSFTSGRSFSGDVTEVGDMDQDGVQDIAVGSTNADDGGTDRGGLWILLMNTNGTVDGNRYYSSNSSSFPWPGGTPLANGDLFGFATCKVGDLNGDGTTDLAVSARFKFNVTGQGRGRVFLMYLNANGTIASYTSIGPGVGGFPQVINGTGGHFGWSIDNVGDLNGDGTTDLLASARQQNVDYTEDGAAFVLYLNTSGTVQAYEEISEDAGLGGASLGLHNYAWFGFRLAALGDLDGDDVMDIAVSANGHNGGGAQRGRIYVMELNPKPIIVSSATTDETITAWGTSTVTIVGGVRPYDTLWVDSVPTTGIFNGWITAIDTVGTDGIGMPVLAKAGLTYDLYETLSAPQLDSIRAGAYHLTVADAAGDTALKDIHVGFDLKSDVLTGATVSSDRDVVKTAATGWSTMECTTRNVLLPWEDGFIRFLIPQTGTKAAVGFRPFGASQSNGYHQMAYAFYISGDSIYRYSVSGHSYMTSLQAGDVMVLERLGTSIRYWHNGELLHQATISAEGQYVCDLNIHTTGRRINGLTTDLRSTFRLGAEVAHLQSMFPSSGGIDVQPLPVTGSYTYAWPGGSTTAQRTGLSQASYSPSITSSHFLHTRTIPILVGNTIIDADTGTHFLSAGALGQDLSRAGTAGWGPRFGSVNTSVTYRTHSFTFTPVLDDAQDDALIMGLDYSTTGTQIASWWVHPFAGRMLAVAVGPTGIIGRVFIRTGDALKVALTATNVTFFVNDRSVLTSSLTLTSAPISLFAALRSSTARAAELRTTLPIPIKLNTSYVVPNIPLSMTTPDGATTNGTSGSTMLIDQRTGPVSGDQELAMAATSETQAAELLFELDSGHVENVRLVADTTYILDSALYDCFSSQELVIYDGPESYRAEDVSAFYLDLEDQLLMTPNGDSSHDGFKVLGLNGEPSYSLTITDRETNVLFSSTDPAVAWNGQYMNTGSTSADGVYLYEIVVDGITYSGQFLLKN